MKVEHRRIFLHVLGEDLEHLEGDGAPVDRGGHLLIYEGERPKLVVVAVEEQISFHLALVGDEVIDAGDHVIDAGHRLVRDEGASADDVDVVVDLDADHALAVLVEAAESVDFYNVVHGCSFPPWQSMARGVCG